MSTAYCSQTLARSVWLLPSQINMFVFTLNKHNLDTPQTCFDSNSSTNYLLNSMQE